MVSGTDRAVGLLEVAARGREKGKPLDTYHFWKREHLTFPNGTHVVEVEVDPQTGGVTLLNYTVAHDSGNVINPMIVDGQVQGGVAHGIGNALFEWMKYDAAGQPLTTSFQDYLLPSAHEVPEVEIVHHCTPSPFTVFGQKGSGESGYLGAPAAISAAVNDCVSALGISFNKLPIRISASGDAIADAQQGKPQEQAK